MLYTLDRSSAMNHVGDVKMCIDTYYFSKGVRITICSAYNDTPLTIGCKNCEMNLVCRNGNDNRYSETYQNLCRVVG